MSSADGVDFLRERFEAAGHAPPAAPGPAAPADEVAPVALDRDRQLPAGGDSGYAVAGASTSRWDRDSVALAVTDVRCKTEVDFVPRMADALAAAQATVLAMFRDELEARLAHMRAVVPVAEAYLAAHPEIP
ncbi:hypothetical protein [Cellulomonas sp.]|uniref:hypothetical protein n=1 Tax=Cellulomonas sp. TaxID=40001 RepID=UPI002D2C5CE4|nr:hypothetical protein [Cellulomonas sp.]HYQ77390.1 hypothetical protein [Cellulomonas sp.]